MPDDQVCCVAARQKTDLSAALSAGWSRVRNARGAGAFADASKLEDVTIKRGIAGPSLPAAENVFNSLAADPTALNEVLSLYGLIATPKESGEVSDMDLITGMSGAVAEYLRRIADGRRCHLDETALAALFRPIIPQMQAIVDADDRRKGVVPMPTARGR